MNKKSISAALLGSAMIVNSVTIGDDNLPPPLKIIHNAAAHHTTPAKPAGSVFQVENGYAKTTIHYNENTARVHPFIKTHLAEWINGAAQDVYLITADDIIESVSDQQTKKILEKAVLQTRKYTKDEISTGAYNQFIEQNKIKALATEALSLYIQKTYPEIHETIIRGQAAFSELALMLIQGDGASYIFNIKFHRNTRSDTALIIAPYRNEDAASAATRLSTMPYSAHKTNTPGTSQEWFAGTVAHEAGHIYNPIGQPLQKESNADLFKYAISDLYKGKKDSPFSTPGMNEYWKHCRAFASVLNQDVDHATHMNFSTGLSEAHYISALKTLNDDIATFVGTSGYYLHTTGEIVKSALNGTTYFEHQAILQPGENEIAKKALEAILNGEITRAEKLIGKLSQRTQEEINDMRKTATRIYGYATLNHHLGTVHEAVKSFLQTDYYKDNPVAHQYAMNFNEAAKSEWFSPAFSGTPPLSSNKMNISLSNDAL